VTHVATKVANKPSVWLEVDLAKLKNNFKICRSYLDSNTAVLAVVKSNSYGHGMIACAKELEQSVQYFGVSNISEALALRDKGIQTPILIFGFFSLEDVPALLKYDLSISLSDTALARKIHEQIEALDWKERLKVHVKIDTGMSRLGFPYHKALDEVIALSKYSTLEIEGVFTHLAASDRQENDFTNHQLDLFEKILTEFQKKDLQFKWIHSANSGGIFHYPRSHFNIVRPGIALYGLYQEDVFESALEPVLAWKTKVVLVKDLNPGDTVSYGRKFKVEQPTRIAVLPVGYSHGYPVSLSSKGQVLIQGVRYSIVGQVCMDHIVIELGSESDVSIDDEVTLLGESGKDRVTATELARLAGTIPYEIVTRLHPSIHRIYTN